MTDRPAPSVTPLRRSLATLSFIALLGAAGAWSATPADGGEATHEVEIHKVVVGCPDGEAGCEGERRIIHRVHGGHGHGHHHGGGWMVRGGSYLGVAMVELTPELRRHFGVPEDVGVMVSQVMEDSPAQRAGVRVGDVVSAVAGDSVGSARQLAQAIAQRPEGEAVVLEIWRDGKLETLTATLETRPYPERAVELSCKDADHDCRFEVYHGSAAPVPACEGLEECEVSVRCQAAGECECEVNGAPVDCVSVGQPGLDE